MRKKLFIQQSFMFSNPNSDLKLVTEYQYKYTMINDLLETNFKILDLAHEDLEKFSTGKGRESVFTSENILRMIIVQYIEQDSFRDVIIRVSGSAFLRNFVKIGCLNRMMDFTFLNKASKYIQPITWQKINALLVKTNIEQEISVGERLRVDSTLCETNIHYPTDSHLLWDSYRVLSRLMRDCNKSEPCCSMGFRFHDKKIKKLFVYISTHSNKRAKRTQQKINNRYKKLIERVGYIYQSAEEYLKHARSLCIISTLLDEIESFLPAIAKVIAQATNRILNNKSVENIDKVFSIFEPHTELIKRGKAGKPIEFGHMVTIAQTEEKLITYYDVMGTRECDNTRTDIVLENHKLQFGHYPKGFTADKNYYKSMEHVEEWEEKIKTFSVGKKGKRNTAETAREHSDDFKSLQKFRAGSEGSISALKRAFGLKRCVLKGFRSFQASVGCLIFCYNLVLSTTL